MPTRAARRAPIWLALAGWLVATAPVPALAAPSAEFASAFRALQAQDARLNSIGFRLATANARSCAAVRPVSGLLLTDAAAYKQAQDVRDLLALKGDIAVQAVAAGSPAEQAGIKPGEEVLGIAELLVPAPDAKNPATTERLNFLHDTLDAILLARGNVPLVLASGPVKVGEVFACKARFELASDGKGAQAGALIVQVSSAMLGEAQGDDEAAFVVAHELAHVVLGHSQPDRSTAERRRQEREADRLAPWLMANAGYDPVAGIAFLRRWGAKGLRVLGDGLHDSPLQREKRVEIQLEELGTVLPDAQGRRDWRPRFAPATPAP